MCHQIPYKAGSIGAVSPLSVNDVRKRIDSRLVMTMRSIYQEEGTPRMKTVEMLGSNSARRPSQAGNRRSSYHSSSSHNDQDYSLVGPFT